MNFVTAERQRLVTTFERVGADAPTLCEGWSAEDLLRHLVIREIYPHVGLFAKVPVGLADPAREQVEELNGQDYDTLLSTFRDGRQKLSPLQVAPVDRAMNTLEYVIHHEDLRRAQNPVLGRVLTGEEQREIFTHLKGMAQMLFAASPVRIVLHAPGIGDITALATKRHKNTVTITGAPVELALFAFGRDSVADVSFAGDASDIEKVTASKRSA